MILIGIGIHTFANLYIVKCLIETVNDVNENSLSLNISRCRNSCNEFNVVVNIDTKKNFMCNGLLV